MGNNDTASQKRQTRVRRVRGLRGFSHNKEKSAVVGAKAKRVVDVKCQEIKSQEQRLRKTKQYGGKSCANSAQVNQRDFRFSHTLDLFTH